MSISPPATTLRAPARVVILASSVPAVACSGGRGTPPSGYHHSDAHADSARLRVTFHVYVPPSFHADSQTQPLRFVANMFEEHTQSVGMQPFRTDDSLPSVSGSTDCATLLPVRCAVHATVIDIACRTSRGTSLVARGYTTFHIFLRRCSVICKKSCPAMPSASGTP